METQSQEKQILDYLLAGNSITPIEALHRFGCFRLSARIADLRKKGYPIKTKLFEMRSGKRVAQYYIEGL